MKIAIIHGQNHKETSYHIGRLLVDKLQSQENISEFFLPKDMPKFCLGCYKCLFKGQEYCPHYNYLEPITKAINSADLLVFTTPVYCLRTTGAMKSLLDHYFTNFVVHRPKEEMYFKKAVIIAVGAGAGMKSAASDIKTSLFYWGISDITVYKARSLSTSWEEVNEKIKSKIETDISKLAVKIKRNNGRAKVSIKSKFMFYLMRMSQLKSAQACPQDREYWQSKGWLDKKRPWKS